MREDDAFESFSERKASTNIPTMIKSNKNPQSAAPVVKSFSERILNGSLKLDVGDIHGVANQMIFEINLIAGKLLILQHKLIEVLKLSPRFIVENLYFEYKEKIRERWNGNILRNVIRTRDFSLPSEENLGETHKKMAKSKRTNEGDGILSGEVAGGGEHFDPEILKVEDISVFG